MKEELYRADPPSQTAFPIAKAGMPYILAAAFVTLIMALLDMKCLTFMGILATLFICLFFRDPDRLIPKVENAVVSPADGRVIIVETLSGNRFTDAPCLRISIFMSVFNVHVNRNPYDGTVKAVQYYPGKFFSADLDKASASNEHNAVMVELPDGKSMGVVQIAGLIARRIICGVQKGDRVSRGARFGMICFGSRLDVYLPADTRPEVSVGDRVSSGSSVLGILS
ncbi:MAG: phosphatidylserine decarboxylase [Desulfobacteraceae bacterium 4572_88]|nr:MAG: phosphatidylserine decarboxylase [Desulfobacteraceae bacterium 4572_88]